MLLFVFVLLLPVVSAVISVDGPDRTRYNRGDTVTISGYLFSETALTGFINFALDCDNVTYPLLSTPVSLTVGEKKRFPEDIVIGNIRLSNTVTGTCFIKASITSGSEVIESDESNIFTVTTDLDGSFSIDSVQVQVGKGFTLTGKVFKLSGADTDGSVEIYFKKDNDTKYMVDTAQLKNGQLEYRYEAIPGEPLRYYIDLIVYDIYGNRQLFEDVASFNLVDEIYIFAKPDRLNVLPGETVTLSGEAKTVLMDVVDKAEINIRLDSQTYQTELVDSRFSHEIQLPENIRTGKHVIAVSIKDLFGNWGSTETTIYVEAVPTRLELEFDKTLVKPEEKIQVTPYVYDQAGDPYVEEVSIEFFDPEGKTLLSNMVKSGEKLDIVMPQFSLPGQWTVKAYAAGLTAEEKIDVDKLLGLDVMLVNQTLYLKNTGNIDYKKPVKINFNDGEYTLVKKMSLSPDEITGLYLFDEVASGQYDIEVIFGDNKRLFEDVIIVSKARKSLNYIYGILIASVFVLLSYLLLLKRQANRPITARLHKKRPVAIIKTKPEKPDKEEGIKSFRERVLKDIKETEERYRQKSEAKGKGMFNMFG